MLTAKEAKDLHNNSSIAVADFLKEFVEEQVKHAATSGKRSVNIYLGAIEITSEIIGNLTPMHTAAIDTLRELGYSAGSSYFDKSYVPFALEDDSGNGPLYINYGILVGW
jgi:hypothetical protein